MAYSHKTHIFYKILLAKEILGNRSEKVVASRGVKWAIN
jgi:hypothetical protein